MTWPPGEHPLPIGDKGDEIRVRVWYARHEVVDFSVQLVTLVSGEFRPVARYDCSHGSAPHRDILDWNGGTVRQTQMRPGISFHEAFDEAIDELLANWPRYIDDFHR